MYLKKNLYLNSINNQSLILKKFLIDKKINLMSQKIIFKNFLLQKDDQIHKKEHTKLITNIKKLIDINYSNIPKNSLDVYKTNGDNKKIINEINYKKKFTKIENVLVPIIEWYKKYKIYDLD